MAGEFRDQIAEWIAEWIGQAASHLGQGADVRAKLSRGNVMDVLGGSAGSVAGEVAAGAGNVAAGAGSLAVFIVARANDLGWLLTDEEAQRAIQRADVGDLVEILTADPGEADQGGVDAVADKIATEVVKQGPPVPADIEERRQRAATRLAGKEMSPTREWWERNREKIDQVRSAVEDADLTGADIGLFDIPSLQLLDVASYRYDSSSDTIIVQNEDGVRRFKAERNPQGEPIIVADGVGYSPDAGVLPPPIPTTSPRGLIGVNEGYQLTRNRTASPGFDIALEGMYGYPNLPRPTDLPGRVVTDDDGTQRWQPWAIDPVQAKQYRWDPVPTEPIYHDGDEFNLFDSLDPIDIKEIENKLYDAGLLADWQRGLGEWGPGHQNAMRVVMDWANGRVETWDQTLDWLARNPLTEPDDDGSGSQRAGFVPEPYLAPDYATLAQQVKSIIRDRLGREPTNAEMILFADTMASDHRADYDQQVAAARSAYGMANKAFETGEDQPSPGTFQQVDYVSRFLQRFDEKYRDEMGVIDQRQTFQDRTNLFLQQLSTMRGIT
jgi:hypothetical protein